MEVKDVIRTAENFVEQIEFFEEWVGRGPIDHAYDYGVHMSDPSARAEDFEREYEESMERAEYGLACARENLTQLEIQYRDVLIAAGWEFVGQHAT